MSGPSISVKADVSGVLAELGKVEKVVKRIQDTMTSGSVGFDADEAKKDLKELNDGAAALAAKMKQLKAEGKLDATSAKTFADALENAANAAQSMGAVMKQSSSQNGIAGMAKDAGKIADNLGRAAKVKAMLERDGFKLSHQQASGVVDGYAGLVQGGGRGSRFLGRYSPDDFFGGGWRNYSVNGREAQNYRNQVLRHLGISGGQGGGLGGVMGDMAGIAGRSVFGSMGGGGIFGRLLGHGAQAAAGAEGGLLGGGGLARLGMGAGIGALAFGAIKLFQGVHAGYGRAKDEATEYSDLRAALGATKVDFGALRESVRHFSSGLGIAYNEAAKLAREFAHVSGVNGKDGMNIGREMQTAIGFGRGFGVAPAESTQFIATMRHFGVSKGDGDNRKLALMIGEAVNRGNAQGKMGEVLSAIQSFVTSSARASLSNPDAGGYASFLSSLTGLSFAGLKGDPTNAAAMMSAADSAMRQGGAFGEASKNFSLGLWQRKLGGDFTTFDMDYLSEQGAFGSIGKAFGKDSVAYKLAQQRGDTGKMAQYERWAAQGGGTSVLAMQMKALEGEYGGNTDGFRKAIQSHFGVGASQAGALYMAYKNDGGLGGLESKLKGAGVDTSTMNMKQVAALADLASTDRSGLDAQRKKLLALTGRNGLSAGDRAALSGETDEGKLRDMVLKLTATHDTLKDQGDIARQQAADIENIYQDIATKLIPFTQTIMGGIIELVKKFTIGKSDWLKGVERDHNTTTAKKGLDSASGEDRAKMARSILNDAALHPEKYDPEFIRSLKDGQPEAPAVATPGGGGRAGAGSPQSAVSSMSKDKSEFLDQTRDAAQRVADQINKATGSSITAADIQAQWGMETGWGKKVISGTNNLGNIKAGGSYKGDRKSVRVLEYDKHGNPYYADQDFKKYRNLDEFADDYAGLLTRRYFKKPTTSAEFASTLKAGGYGTDPNYVDKLNKARSGLTAQQDGKVPPGAAAAPNGTQTVTVNGKLVVVDKDGRPTGQEVPLSGSVAAPQPTGRRPYGRA